jgi:hypothetical protein
MPAKLRAAKDRRPQFGPEVLALIRELDSTPKRARESAEFKAKERTLMRQLNLVNEWWSMTSVLDRSDAPCWPPWNCAFDDWHTCRAVRLALLEAGSEVVTG